MVFIDYRVDSNEVGKLDSPKSAQSNLNQVFLSFNFPIVIELFQNSAAVERAEDSGQKLFS